MVTTRKSKVHLNSKENSNVDSTNKRKYITTYKDIKTYFKLVNSALFDGKTFTFNSSRNQRPKKTKCIGQVVVLEWKRAILDCTN